MQPCQPAMTPHALTAPSDLEHTPARGWPCARVHCDCLEPPHRLRGPHRRARTRSVSQSPEVGGAPPPGAGDWKEPKLSHAWCLLTCLPPSLSTGRRRLCTRHEMRHGNYRAMKLLLLEGCAGRAQCGGCGWSSWGGWVAPGPEWALSQAPSFQASVTPVQLARDWQRAFRKHCRPRQAYGPGADDLRGRSVIPAPSPPALPVVLPWYTLPPRPGPSSPGSPVRQGHSEEGDR